ncbi:alpha/beta hydrolase [Nitrosomonas sp. Is37]|uniref:alpha/beta hydrolase n=1 Tax=Nitrosomonas sp. Is37 TaxID=3080535 RepID=UPI00294AB687|nr:alpha/beta hydrolase [Nitrosomonas sp. Is37]MDV6345460.1 alpha/beta hydrolase [Nitrosomonas sp. Is37]
MKTPTEHKLFIKGPAGKLETIVLVPASKPRGIAIIAHPHPLYHGNMDNKVVYILSKALIESGYITVKFNFRGVGASEGNHAEGIGEVEDVLAITQAIRHQYDIIPYQLPLLLAGFSFGGAIQAYAAQQLNPQKLVLIAPSVDRLNAPAVINHADSVLIVHGDQDDIVSLRSVLDWATPQIIPVVVIPGAEHFFHGKLSILKQIILNACQI